MSTSILIIAGFLGSGKTSLILGLAQVLATRSQRVAVVENESGNASVDDRLLRRSGLEVSALAAGCVCCSLAADLRESVSTLCARGDIDVILVEPSGIAGPGQVCDALRGVAPIRVLGVLDAQRWLRLMELNPDYVDGLGAASQVVAVTKADRVDPSPALVALAAVHPRLPALAVRADDPAAAVQLLDLLESAPFVDGSPAFHAPWRGSTRASVQVWNDLSTEAIEASATALVAKAVQAVVGPDGIVPGHIKAFIDGGSAGWLSLHATMAGSIERKGAMAGMVAEARVTLMEALVRRGNLLETPGGHPQQVTSFNFHGG